MADRRERLLSTAEEIAQLRSWQMDVCTGRPSGSDQLYRLHGLEPGAEEPGAEVVLAFVHLDDRGRLAGLLEEVLTRPKRVPAEGVKVEYRSPAAVGSWERGSRACRRARLEGVRRPCCETSRCFV